MKNRKNRQIYAQALWEREMAAFREDFDRSFRSCPATAHLHRDFQLWCRSCVGRLCAKMVARGLDDDGQALPYKDRPACGALIRIGAMCANRVVPGKTKCHMHGGKSTGPKTDQGKAKIAEAQRQRWARYRDEKAKAGARPLSDRNSK
jgi:hypothetical protein